MKVYQFFRLFSHIYLFYTCETTTGRTWQSSFMAATLTTLCSAVVRCSRWLRAHESHRNSSHFTQQCDDRRARFVHFFSFVFLCSSCCCCCCSCDDVMAPDELQASQYRAARDSIASTRLLNKWWSGRDSTPLRIGSSHSWNTAAVYSNIQWFTWTYRTQNSLVPFPEKYF